VTQPTVTKDPRLTTAAEEMHAALEAVRALGEPPALPVNTVGYQAWSLARALLMQRHRHAYERWLLTRDYLSAFYSTGVIEHAERLLP
jgi:hypothetical protein